MQGAAFATPTPPKAASRPSQRTVARKLTGSGLAYVDQGGRLSLGSPKSRRTQMRAMELQAGKPQKKGNKPGPAYAYNVKTLRDQERRVAEQAQRYYERFVETWRPRPPDEKARGRLNPARLE